MQAPTVKSMFKRAAIAPAATNHAAITIARSDEAPQDDDNPSCTLVRSTKNSGVAATPGNVGGGGWKIILALMLSGGLAYHHFGTTWGNASNIIAADPSTPTTMLAADAPPVSTTMVASDASPARPQGFRNVKEVRCNDAVGENACEGAFEYVPRLAGAIPPLVSAETQAACLANWTTASEAGSDRSRFDEDLLIYRKYFADRPTDAAPGFFLELGGFDGLTETNTRFFEACLGWSGLLIEASPLSFEQLKANAPRRPNSDLLNVAPSCENFEFVHLLNHANTGISLHEAVYEGEDPLSWQVKAQCGPLSFYLRELGVTTIDFLSLDVEAFEYYVLRTIDFKALDVKVLLVEVSNRFYDSKTEKFDRLKEQVLEALAEGGYVEDTSIEVRSSKVFVKRDAQ